MKLTALKTSHKRAGKKGMGGEEWGRRKGPRVGSSTSHDPSGHATTNAHLLGIVHRASVSSFRFTAAVDIQRAPSQKTESHPRTWPSFVPWGPGVFRAPTSLLWTCILLPDSFYVLLVRPASASRLILHPPGYVPFLLVFLYRRRTCCPCLLKRLLQPVVQLLRAVPPLGV